MFCIDHLTLQFLSDLREVIRDRDSLAILHCLTGDNPPQNRSVTEYMSDVVFELDTNVNGEAIENRLVVPKFRDGYPFKEVLKLELRDGVAGDTSRARFLVFSAETAFNWRSVLLTGTLQEVTDEVRRTGAEAGSIAWRPALFERASDDVDTRLYEFRIDDRSGVKHPGLPPGLDASPE
jgi:hypothetical protein